MDLSIQFKYLVDNTYIIAQVLSLAVLIFALCIKWKMIANYITHNVSLTFIVLLISSGLFVYRNIVLELLNNPPPWALLLAVFVFFINQIANGVKEKVDLFKAQFDLIKEENKKAFKLTKYILSVKVQLEKKLGGLKSMVRTIDRVQTALDRDVLSLTKRMDRMEIVGDKLTKSYEKLEVGFSILTHDVSKLKTDVSELKTDVSELKTDVSEMKKSINLILELIQNK